MLVRIALGALGLLAAGSGLAAQERSPVGDPPVVAVTGPTVIAFWLVPASDSVLLADPDLASALDDQQYYWAETRALLTAMGITPRDQPGRRFVVREPDREWTFTAVADSGATGFLLLEPGRAPRVLYRRWFPDELVEAARAFFAR